MSNEQNINVEIENAATSRELAELIPMHWDAKPRPQPVMVWGDSGIGKSDLAHQLAVKTKRKPIMFMLNVREPVDMRGVPMVDPKTKTTMWCTPSELPKADGSDGDTLLILDEINTGGVQMLAVAMQLVLAGEIGDYRLPSNCRILAMGNRSKDSRAVVQMPKPLRNRFAHYTMVVDHDSLIEHLKRVNCRDEIVAFIRFRPDCVTRQPKGDANAYGSPRSVHRCESYVDARPRLRLKAFSAMIGKDDGTELEAFVAMYQSLTSIADILANPTTAKLPSERSEMYAVATALGRLADKKNFQNIVTYAKRLGAVNRDMEVLIVTDATDRDQKLCETSAYAKWAVDNQDVTLRHFDKVQS